MVTSEMSERLLRLDARRAYEIGRLRGALVRGAGALALALPGFVVCGRTPLAALCLVGLALVVAAGRFRGEGFADGARAGFLAGILPCLLPAVLRILDPELCDTLFMRGPWLCAVAGITAGVILGVQVRAGGGSRFWGSAAVTLGFAVTLGCIPAGLMGFTGLLIGVVAGGLPVLAARRVFT